MVSLSRLACVHLDTPSLDASIDFYGRCFGLSVSDGTEDAVCMTAAADTGATLVLRRSAQARLAGLEFETGSALALSAARTAVADLLVEDGLAFGEGGSVTLLDPDGTLIRIRREAPTATSAPGDRPEHMSHIVLNSPDTKRLVAFYVERLGFRISDAYERDLLTFLRCDQPQHHCLGIAPGDAAGLNHFAVDCGDIDTLMKSVGRMKQAGYEPIWGPGRHGPGGNVFCYYADPTGLVAEFTCEVLQIEDDAAWTPKVWERTPGNGNVWGTGAPSPDAVAMMAGYPPRDANR